MIGVILIVIVIMMIVTYCNILQLSHTHIYTLIYIYIYDSIYISYCKCIMITHIDTYWHILSHIDTYWHILTHIDTLLLFWWWWWWRWWFPLDFHFCFRIFGNLWKPRPAPGESLGTLWEPSTWYLGKVAFFSKIWGIFTIHVWQSKQGHDGKPWFFPPDSRQTHIFLMEKTIENCDSTRDSKRNQPWDYHFGFATGWYGISHL